jgi:hypothetical protein
MACAFLPRRRRRLNNPRQHFRKLLDAFNQWTDSHVSAKISFVTFRFFRVIFSSVWQGVAMDSLYYHLDHHA